VHDPFFKATTPWELNDSLFKADLPWTVIACTEQYSFCNKDNCTGYDAIAKFNDDRLKREIGLKGMQVTTFSLLSRGISTSVFQPLIFQLKHNLFLASKRLLDPLLLSPPLPDDQWSFEVRHLFNVSLATLQVFMLGFASPPPLSIDATTNTEQTFESFVIPPTEEDAKKICNTQKIRSTEYYSFNFVGLLIILIVGVLLILVASFVPWLVGRRKERSKNPKTRYQQQEWENMSPLHLFRLALQGQGVWPWNTQMYAPILENINKKVQIYWLDGTWEPQQGIKNEKSLSVDSRITDKQNLLISSGEVSP